MFCSVSFLSDPNSQPLQISSIPTKGKKKDIKEGKGKRDNKEEEWAHKIGKTVLR
jgi:hypothetical protein